MAMGLAELTYCLTADFPKHETYGLTSQMRRAAVSIPSNIAEGSARASRKDFRHFILISKGSTCELQTQSRLGYLSEANYRETESLSGQVARLLSGLARSLKPPLPPPTT